MACKILSVAETAPAPLTNPVNTFPITVALGTVAALPTEVTSPVKFALVVTLPAVNPAAVPVIFVPTKAEGVPKLGVTNVGLVFITNVEPVPVCDATLVAFPTLVIGPVRLALVTTVVAKLPVPVPVTPPVNVIVWSPVLVPEILDPDTAPENAAVVPVIPPVNAPPALGILFATPVAVDTSIVAVPPVTPIVFPDKVGLI